MKTNGQNFLQKLASFPASTFEGKFVKSSVRLRLPSVLNDEDLSRLYRASFRAQLCHIAFNGLGGCGGSIRPEQEPNRIRLEQEFMSARQQFLLTPGYKGLKVSLKKAIQAAFLTILIDDENLDPENPQL